MKGVSKDISFNQLSLRHWVSSNISRTVSFCVRQVEAYCFEKLLLTLLKYVAATYSSNSNTRIKYLKIGDNGTGQVERTRMLISIKDIYIGKFS